MALDISKEEVSILVGERGEENYSFSFLYGGVTRTWLQRCIVQVSII